MTTMTDEATIKIAESIIKKYNNAGRKMLIILKNSGKFWSKGTMNDREAVNVAINLVYELVGERAEAVFKDAAKQAKQLKKEEAKDAKRKKNA